MKRRFIKPRQCSSTGKSMFTTEKDAGRAMMRIWSHDTKADIKDLHTYICPDCKAWHVGHASYFQKTLENQNVQRFA